MFWYTGGRSPWQIAGMAMTATENPDSVQLDNEQAGAVSSAGEPPPVPEAQTDSATAPPAGDAGEAPPVSEVPDDSAATPATTANAPAKVPAELVDKLAKLSHKQSQELINLRLSLERLGMQGTASDQWRALQELLEKNHEYQQQLQQRMRTQLTTLGEALEAGRSREVLSLWDRVQGNIKQCTGQLKRTMQKEAGACKGPVLEMRKWRIYAATEKKKQLIAEMSNLPDAGLSAPDLGRRIQKMHEQWKALGRSDQNERLWREFKKLSDQVYAPCKEYYRERKKRMAANLKIRIELCEKLEQRLTELEGQPLHIVKLNHLISECNTAWKEHAPVEQSKIKPLQKRYYAVLKKLTNLRKETMKENGVRKRSCLERAKALAALEDHGKAAGEARKLQSEWKHIGPADFREEKRFREEFRVACDAVFKQLNEHRARERERQRERPLSPQLQAHAELLKKLAPRAEFLERQEQSQFAAEEEKQYTESLRGLNSESWEQLPPAGDETRDGELSQRLEALLAAGSRDKLNALSCDCEKQHRRVCVQLEISAGVNSPREDQSLRMELQLQQLASGFGKRAPDAGDLAQSLREAELALLCVGPMTPDARKELRQRLGRLSQRINSRPPRSRTG